MIPYTGSLNYHYSEFIISLARYLKVDSKSLRWIASVSRRESLAAAGYATQLIAEAMSFADFDQNSNDFNDKGLQFIRKIWL